MATTTVRLYRISGSVTDVNSGATAANIRVEAWDRVAGTPVIFGSAVSDFGGSYQISIDESVLPGAPQVIPAIFLKAFSGSAALVATGTTSIKSAQGSVTNVTANIQVDLSAMQTPETDRISPSQIYSAINFVHLTDFGGLLQEGMDRVSSLGSLLGDGAKSFLGSVNISPVQAPAVRTSDLINQDPATAQNRLKAQGVQVGQIQQYTPGLDSVSAVTSLAGTVKPGDTVNLLVANGVIKGYVVQKPVTATVSPSDVNQLKTDVLGLKADMTQVKAAETVVNPNDVTQLKNDVLGLKTDMTQVKSAETTINPNDVTQLKNDVVGLKTDMTQVKSADAAAAAQNTADIAALKAKAAALDDLTAKFATLQQQSTQKDTTIADLTKRLSTLETGFQKISKG